MRWSIDNFVQAKELVGDVLEELGLENYRFEVEPDDHGSDAWRVRVECQGQEGWKTTELHVDRAALEHSRHPKSEARLELLEAWRARLC